MCTKWKIKKQIKNNRRNKKKKFGSGIEENNKIKIKIQKPTAARKHQNNHAKKKQNFEHHTDKKKQKFDIHVASIL